ncbi:MAG: DUF58 domain-containing protein [Chloroflexi bacterium]|nr:DUF58 domain-containing protein [Chloroflexota bacterium]
MASRDSRPTVRAASVAAGSLVMTGLALLLANPPLLAAGIFCLFVVGIGLALRPAGPGKVSRVLDRTSVSIRERVHIKWQIDAPSGYGPLFVHDSLPADLPLDSGSNVRVFWKGLSEGHFLNAYGVECSKRGSYAVPPTSWESCHVLGLREAVSGTGSARSEFSVFPKLLPVRRLRTSGGIASALQPAGALATLGVATTDFKEIREYVAGDPMRSINWKATARHSAGDLARPLVNEFEREGKRAVWLFVDCSKYMTVGTNLVNPLEHAVEAANAVGHYFLTRGYYLGAHFSCFPDDFLYPDVGRQHYLALGRRLVRLQPSGDSYDIVRAAWAARQNLLAYAPVCVIVTRLDLDDEPVGPRGAQTELLLSGVSTLLHLSPGRIRRMPVWLVAIHGYQYAAEKLPGMGFARELRRLETRPVVREMRSRGATVIEWDPIREAFANVLLRTSGRGRRR